MTTKVGRMTRAAVLCLLMAAAMPLTVAGQAPTPPAAVDEFVPLDLLPPEDEIPAAPGVVAAVIVTEAEPVAVAVDTAAAAGPEDRTKGIRRLRT